MSKILGSITMRSAAMVLISFALACGSNDKASSARGVTSIDTSRALSSLSTSDLQTLCSDLTDYLVQQTANEHTQRRCIQTAFLAANLSSATDQSSQCHDSYTSCIADAANTEASSGISITALCPSNPTSTTCSLTGSQYIECLDQISVAAKAAWALRQDLCDNLLSCTATCNSPLTLPSACALVRDTCPGMIPGVAYVTIS